MQAMPFNHCIFAFTLRHVRVLSHGEIIRPARSEVFVREQTPHVRPWRNGSSVLPRGERDLLTEIKDLRAGTADKRKGSKKAEGQK
jgi:hypothetical protein